MPQASPLTCLPSPPCNILSQRVYPNTLPPCHSLLKALQRTDSTPLSLVHKVLKAFSHLFSPCFTSTLFSLHNKLLMPALPGEGAFPSPVTFSLGDFLKLPTPSSYPLPLFLTINVLSSVFQFTGVSVSSRRGGTKSTNYRPRVLGFQFESRYS